VKATTAAVAGLILPGDRVDVLVYLRKSADVAETGTRTILKDVRVFAVNEHTDRETDENGKIIIAKTVSLLLTPGQVETLLLKGRHIS